MKKEKFIDTTQITPFSEKYYSQYERIYNECFYEMCQALDIKLYDFYADIEQIKGKMDNLFMLLHNETIIGSVGCYGTEIDDLIVNKNIKIRDMGILYYGGLFTI